MPWPPSPPGPTRAGRRCWWCWWTTPAGTWPKGWLYVYGFTRPSTGQTFTALLPRVNADRMGDALAAFAAWADPGGQKVLVVLVDNPGWHVAKRLAVRLRLHPALDRPDLHGPAAAGERGPDGRCPGRLRRLGRPGRAEGAGGAGGQPRLARGQKAGCTSTASPGPRPARPSRPCCRG